MFPTVGDLLGVALDVPTHGLFVALGVCAAALVFVLEARRRGATDDRLLWVVVGALVGGGVLMRMGTWLQHVQLRENAGLAEQWLYGNRSVLGGLVGAWLGVHVAKRLVGYRLRTGDLFAPAVALGMAVGRVGCLLTEVPGTPTGTAYGIRLDAEAAARLGVAPGVPLHLSFGLAALVSAGLVASYLKAVGGMPDRWWQAVAAQAVYLVAFSYAFFFEGFTGLAVTIGAIVTLFVLMQMTARVRWAEVFEPRGIAPGGLHAR